MRCVLSASLSLLALHLLAIELVAGLLKQVAGFLVVAGAHALLGLGKLLGGVLQILPGPGVLPQLLRGLASRLGVEVALPGQLLQLVLELLRIDRRPSRLFQGVQLAPGGLPA